MKHTDRHALVTQTMSDGHTKAGGVEGNIDEPHFTYQAYSWKRKTIVAEGYVAML